MPVPLHARRSAHGARRTGRAEGRPLSNRDRASSPCAQRRPAQAHAANSLLGYSRKKKSYFLESTQLLDSAATIQICILLDRNGIIIQAMRAGRGGARRAAPGGPGLVITVANGEQGNADTVREARQLCCPYQLRNQMPIRWHSLASPRLASPPASDRFYTKRLFQFQYE